MEHQHADSFGSLENSSFWKNDSNFLDHYMRFVAVCVGHISGYDDFRNIVRNHVRILIPHKITVVGIGRSSLENILIDHMVAVDFPEQLLAKINPFTSLSDRPVIRHWLMNKRPILIQRDSNYHLLSELERWENETFDLGSLAIHGYLDMSGKMASYFCFCQVENLSEHHAVILEMVIPHLQVALMKAHAAEASGQKNDLLTRKESEILQWLAVGKTNREIAIILQKSELTVRNQVHCILRKLNASTRSEAALRADELGLLTYWQNFQMNRHQNVTV